MTVEKIYDEDEYEGSDQVEKSTSAINPLNLYIKVQKPADDTFIKSIVREYLSISGEKLKSPKDLHEILYSHLRIDPDSGGSVDEESKTRLIKRAREDYYKNHTSKPEVIPTRVQPGWYTFKSWSVIGGEKIPDDEQAHRFYINSKNPEEFCNVLYDEYRRLNIPFYFKTHREDAGRGSKDSVVIYTSTKHLSSNLKIFEEIEENHPDIVAKCNRPHEFVGPINGWLGYASEPANATDSYTSNMCRVFASAIKKAVDSLVENNPNYEIGGVKLSGYFHELMTWDERHVKTQEIIRLGHRISPGFVQNFCNQVREEMVANRINPENICFDDGRRREVEEFYSVDKK